MQMHSKILNSHFKKTNIISVIGSKGSVNVDHFTSQLIIELAKEKDKRTLLISGSGSGHLEHIKSINALNPENFGYYLESQFSTEELTKLKKESTSQITQVHYPFTYTDQSVKKALTYSKADTYDNVILAHFSLQMPDVDAIATSHSLLCDKIYIPTDVYPCERNQRSLLSITDRLEKYTDFKSKVTFALFHSYERNDDDILFKSTKLKHLCKHLDVENLKYDNCKKEFADLLIEEYKVSKRLSSWG